MVGFLAVIAVLAFSLVSMLTAVPIASAQTCSFAPGSVVQLAGTPHLFIADAQGVLHWGGDTRGLAGHTIEWSNRCNIGLDALRAARRGDPWLSSGLPQVGEAIFLSKWEDNETAPTLLHIQTIADVELFGINAGNYGNFVLDRATYESRYGFRVGTLQIGPLASAASFAWSPADQGTYSQLLTNLENIESTALSQAQQSGVDANVAIARIIGCEQRGLSEFERSRNGGSALTAAQSCLGGTAGPPGPGPGPVTGAPATPGGVQVIPGEGNALRIVWTDTATNEEGFRVRRGNQVIATLPANATTHVDVSADPRSPSCYSVTAFNSVGESPSTQICPGGPGGPGGPVGPTNPGAPTAPVNLVVSQQGTGLRLDWIDTSTVEDGFRILRGGQVIGTVGPNVLTFTDPSVPPGTPPCYGVIAFNPLGEAPSEQECLGAPSPGGTLNAPANLRLFPVVGGPGVRLEWMDTSLNEEGFRIVRAGQPIGTVGPNITTFTDPGAVLGTPQCYVVVAFNPTGQAQSNQVCTGP